MKVLVTGGAGYIGAITASALERAGHTPRHRPGCDVRELVAAVETVLGRSVPVQDAPRRDGDAIGAYANVDRARELLGWSAQYSLMDGVASAIAWAGRRELKLGHSRSSTDATLASAESRIEAPHRKSPGHLAKKA